MQFPVARLLSRSFLFFLLLLPAVTVQAQDPRDPWEGFNRKIFAFNETLDRWVLKPVARGYRVVTPDFADRCVTRFFGNLHDVADIPNYALQGDFAGSRDSALRVIGNTSVGLGGLLDPASSGGIANRDTTFGTTLGKWGVGSGNYLVLPFMGPGTVRDTAAIPVDLAFDPLPEPWTIFESEGTRTALGLIMVIDGRADLLDYEQAVIGDRYSFLRDVYLQRRDFDVNGSAAEDPFLDEDFSDDESGSTEAPAATPPAEPSAEIPAETPTR